MFKVLSLFSLVVLVFSGCGLPRVYNVPTKNLTSTYEVKQVESAIASACKKNKWTYVKVNEGKINATYSQGSIMAKVKIRYTASTYSINYLDSSANLKHNANRIHKKYNALVKRLYKRISSNLKSISKEKVIDIAVPLSTQTAQESLPQESITCESTFKVSGSIMSGRTISAKRLIKNINKEEAVTQATLAFTSEGFIIDNTNTKMGMISAHETKRGGRVFPINLMFSEEKESNLLGNMTVATPAGSAFSLNTMKTYLCSNIFNKITSTGYVKKEQKTSVPSQNIKDVKTRLKELSTLHKEGLITTKEYKETKSKILNDM